MACPADVRPDRGLGSITFRVVNSLGEKIQPNPYRIGSLRRQSYSNKYEPLEPNVLSVDTLPFGGYEYKLEPLDRTLFDPLSGNVSLARGERRLLVVVAREIPRIQASYRIPDGGFRAGQVVPPPSRNELMWITLLHPFSGEICEQNRVEDSGTFRFYWRHTGKFLLVVNRDAEIAYTMTLILDGAPKELLRIDLRRGATKDLPGTKNSSSPR